jgi:hypothetical protein
MTPTAAARRVEPLTDRDAWPRIEAQRAEALLIIGAQGCGACRRLRALLHTLDEVDLPDVIFDVEAERAPGLLAELELFHLPGLYLVRDGELHVIQTELSAPALVAAIAAARGRAAPHDAPRPAPNEALHAAAYSKG